MKVNQRVIAQYVTLGANIAEPFFNHNGKFDIGQFELCEPGMNPKFISSTSDGWNSSNKWRIRKQS
jgi:hypothetical protein